MKIAIIGAGIVGLTVARSLLKTGADITIFEKGNVPNKYSSSYDSHRIFKFDDNVSMNSSNAALRAWKDIWLDLNKNYYINTGVTQVYHDPSEIEKRTIQAKLNETNSFKILNNDSLQNNYSCFNFTPTSIAIHNDMGGILLADQIIISLVDWCKNQGIRFRPNTPVVNISKSNTTLITSGGEEFKADLIISCTGAWTSKLILDLPMVPTIMRQILTYAQAPKQYKNFWNSCPVMLIDDLYIVPKVGQLPIKFGATRHRQIDDPDNFRGMSVNEDHSNLPYFTDHIRNIDDYDFKYTHTCYYAVNDENQFDIRRNRDTIVISNCCGRMFKYAPLIALKIYNHVKNKSPISCV